MIADLKGKVVLITGASTGIGAAAAIAFARLGSKLVVHYNESRTAAEAVAAQIKGLGASVTLAQGDVMQEANVKRIVAETMAVHGRIDVLINNAGGMLGRVRIEDYTAEQIGRVVALNVTQVALFMR
jgi:3-oxoacyl-[acyl-carrier protein] reductase